MKRSNRNIRSTRSSSNAGRHGRRPVALAAVMMMVLAMTACGGGPAGSVSDIDADVRSEEATLTTQKEETPEAAGETEAAAGVVGAGSKEQAAGQIYLYGEMHGEQVIIEKEYELWKDYYHNDGLRHMFLESPYYTAEFLNLWMDAEDDEILDEVYADWEGSPAHNPYLKEFYEKIKQECPETIFHGTDVGHQYDTTGKRYLNYLKDNQLEKSEQYQLTQECMEQGKYYYDNSDDVYRENKMAENFVRTFNALHGESVVGFYGGAHVGLDAMEYSTKSVPCMANQLYAFYGNDLHSEDLTWIRKDIDPERMDTVTVAGKEYQASYFGKEDLTGFNDFSYREFWRLEDAYEDFKNLPKTGDVLPYDNYPMLIENGQVFILEIGKTDGSVMRAYYRSDGNEWQGRMTTEEFQVSK